MALKTGSFATGFLQGKYIPVSFSIHRNGKYNIIFVRTDLITPDPSKPDYIKNLQPANQSSRFVLNEFPPGMTWENNGRSYTAANFVFDSVIGGTRIPYKDNQGVCVVCTELVGSREDDMFFANKVRDFPYTGLDGTQKKGLRGAQITSILKMINSYNGTFPDFLVGDMGGMYDVPSINITKLGDEIVPHSRITYQQEAWDFFKKKHPDLVQYFLSNPVTGQGNINDYLSNGFNDALENYSPYTIAPNTAGDTITKSTPPLLSSYIFSKGAQGTNISTTSHTHKLISDIAKLGGNIPISLSFDVSTHLSDISAARQGRATKSINISAQTQDVIKLFTEEELQRILQVIDNLMANFAFGRSPYLRRDLGCLSLRDGGAFSNRELPTLYDKKTFGTGKSLLKIPINKIKFGHLEHVANYPENQVGINQLKDLYCQEFPSIIDTYLFQASGKFSNAAKAGEFYSVNQTTSSAQRVSGDTFNFPSKLKILSDAEAAPNPEDKLLTPDIAIRLFVMPRRHLKLVMGIDLEKHGASNLRKLTTLALENFYATYATSRLEGRLSEILQSRTGPPSDASVSAQPSYNILSHLLEKTADGHLTNLNDGNAILDLFEIIFIFLRLKFIDQQVILYNIKTKEEQKEQTKLEKTVIHSIQDKSTAGNLFDTITNLLSTSQDPLNKILYNLKIIRKDPAGQYLLEPKTEKDPNSFFGIIAKGYDKKSKSIPAKPIAELAKQKLLGLQYMESFLSNELGARLETIANILEHQVITPESQTHFNNKTNLAEGIVGIPPTEYELANLEANILVIHRATQVAEPKEVAMANDILARCRTILQNINQISDVWQEYFVNLIRVLEHYNQTIRLLVLFENNEENPPQFTKADIVSKLKSIFRDTEKALSSINKLPFQLSKDVELLYSQMKQVKTYIENPTAHTDLQLSFLNALELSQGKSLSTIQAQYEPTIHDIQLRTSYLIFNRIISIAYPNKPTTTTPNSPLAPVPAIAPAPPATLKPVDYKELERLCDLLEIGYYNFNNHQSTIHKGGSGNLELLRKNYEILVKISRYIWISMDILGKDQQSYDFVSRSGAAATKPTVELSKLLDEIVSSLSQFNDMVGKSPKNKVLCGYIIKPIGLLADFAYHITNAFTNDTRKAFGVDQLITDSATPATPTTALNELYRKLKYALGKGNDLGAVNTAHSYANITMISGNISGALGSLPNSMNYGDVGNASIVALKGLENYEEFVRHDEVMQLQTDKIVDASSIASVVSVEENYNQFKMDNLKKMADLDDRISVQIRNLQANDYCDSNATATKLENEVITTYKPSIFNLDVATFKSTPAHPGGTIYGNYMDKTDNSMLYLFLDVIDYCKNNQVDIGNIYSSISNELFNFSTMKNLFTTNQFSSIYEQTRILFNNDNRRFYLSPMHTGFNDSLSFIFEDTNLDVDTKNYLARGSPLFGELANDRISAARPYNNFLFLLYNLLYLKRFTITNADKVNRHLPDEGFISIIYGESGTTPDTSRLTDGKKFCINYFNGNEINFNENMYIDLSFLRRYFLKVIYENPVLTDRDGNCLDKISRIRLILSSIFALSYLLNHNPSQPKSPQEIKEFAFMLLGISTLKNYTPSLYFKIGAIINTTNLDASFKWTDKFISYFLKDKVSYYFPKVAMETVNINNDTVISYLKSLCVSKSNLFASDIYNDSNPKANNCMKVMGFINTARSLKSLEVNNVLQLIYLIRRLYVLLGTKEKGLLHDYQQKYNLDLNAGSDKGLPHLFCINDYLEAIGFGGKIDKIYNLIVPFSGSRSPPNYDNCKNICADNYNIIQKCIDNINLIINTLPTYIDKLLLKCFNLGNYDISPDSDTTKPLYHFKKLINYIADCMAFALEYYIPSSDEITDFSNNKYQDKMTGIFNMILDIFKNELNTLLRPYFSLKLEKEEQDDDERIAMIAMNKSMIDLIKTNLAVLGTTSASGKLPDYSFLKSSLPSAPPNSDLEIFDFINRLITCHDENGNYYAIGDTNILESYLTKREILDFVESISKNGYLFNDIQVSLNTKYFAELFTTNDKLKRKSYPTAGSVGTDAPEVNLRCPYLTNNDHIFTHNKRVKFNYFNNKIFNKMKDLFINYFTYFNFYSNTTIPLIANDFYHNNTKNINLFIQGVVNQNSTDIDGTIQANKAAIKQNYNTTIDNEIKGDNTFSDAKWSDIAKAINGGDIKLAIKSIIYNTGVAGAGDLHNIINEYFADILIAQATIAGAGYGPGNDFTPVNLNSLSQSPLQKLIQEINNLYFNNGITDYNSAQLKIKEIHTIFNNIMESLDAKIKLLKTKSGCFEYSRRGDNTNYASYAPPNLAFIRNTRNAGRTYDFIDIRVANHGTIDNLLQREYWNIEDFLDGIKECLLDLIGLVPMPLYSNYVNRSLTHRNNLFLATSALGYMNMRNIEYSLKYNIYADVKLGCFALLDKIPKYFGGGEGMRFYANSINMLENYFRSVNILEDVNKGLLNTTNTNLKGIVDKKPNQQLSEFLQLRLNTATPSDKDNIAKNIQELYKYCRIYTHPCFNFNSKRCDKPTEKITLWGTGGKEIPTQAPASRKNFEYISANQLTKHTLLHFIKHNFNKTSTLDNYRNKVNKILEGKLKAPTPPKIYPFYDKWVKAKNYLSSARGNTTNMKNSLVALYNSWYNLLSAFNNSNRQLFSEIINSATAPTPTPTPTPIQLSTSGGNEYLELRGTIDSNTLNTKYAPKLLELFNNTINIERVREFADKFLRNGLFMYLVYYNLINDAQYNIPVHKYYKAKTSAATVSDFIEFVYCYLDGLKEKVDIDDTSEIAKLGTNYQPAFFTDYATNMLSIQDFILPTHKPNNYAHQVKCLNPNFYKVVSRFIGHILTKYNSTTPTVDIKYAHEQLIGVDGNIFFGSDIFTLASKILSLESKSFARHKESLMLELYKGLELSKHLREFSARYKAIFKDPSIAPNLILAGGGSSAGSAGSAGITGNETVLNEKTKMYKSLLPSRSAKLTMIIKKYNEKTKKNLFQAKAESCNCNGAKHRRTKTIIDF